MTTRLDRPVSEDKLFIWVMHRFGEVFEDHAIIKGGMALRLLDSPRHTTDIDYVFIPFTSKKQIVKRIEEVLAELIDADVQVTLHSKMLRAAISMDGVSIQLEANVATECDSIPMATGEFAESTGQLSQVVRVMSPEHAIAHKIAAWNERRLARDLYDCYFLSSRTKATPNLTVLDRRLMKFESRLPKLRRRRHMSRAEFIEELQTAALELTEKDLEQGLASTLPPAELSGLELRIRSGIAGLIEKLD